MIKTIVAVKYLILLFAFIAGIKVFDHESIALAIVASGAFIAYAIIEIQDVRIANMPETAKE